MNSLVRDTAELLSEMHPDVPWCAPEARHLATYLSVEATPLFTKDVRVLQAAARLGVLAAA